MCNMDFPKYELVGAKLIRTKTLAVGDTCCDFHVIKEKLDNNIRWRSRTSRNEAGGFSIFVKCES